MSPSFSDWSLVLVNATQSLWYGVITFLPEILVAIIVFIAGWVVGTVIGRFVAQIIRSLKLDQALESLGLSELLNRAGFKLDSGHFIGSLVKWFIIVVFLTASVDVLGLSAVNDFLSDVVSYLPNVIVASLILVIAALLAEVIQRIVVGAAKGASMPSANLLGGMAKWAIWVTAFIAALEHLGISPDFLRTLYTGLVALFALAGGLAFGLGGRDAAARFIERLRSDISNRG